MKPSILVPLLIVLAVSGCQTTPPQSSDAGNGEEHRVFVLERGIDQVRDADSGEAFHVICEACAKPTIKTRYRLPVPVSLLLEPRTTDQRAFPIPITPQEVAQARQSTLVQPVVGQPFALKRLVPFAFGRSRLGPQGREAMNAILAEAKEAVRVHVRGHTDIIGKMPGNKRLAMARAAEIRTYLVKGGVMADRITTSYCVDCFTDTNETTVGRAVNRRAMLVMMPTTDASVSADLGHRNPCRVDATQDAISTSATGRRKKP